MEDPYNGCQEELDTPPPQKVHFLRTWLRYTEATSSHNDSSHNDITSTDSYDEDTDSRLDLSVTTSTQGSCPHYYNTEAGWTLGECPHYYKTKGGWGPWGGGNGIDSGIQSTPSNTVERTRWINNCHRCYQSATCGCAFLKCNEADFEIKQNADKKRQKRGGFKFFNFGLKNCSVFQDTQSIATSNAVKCDKDRVARYYQKERMDKEVIRPRSKSVPPANRVKHTRSSKEQVKAQKQARAEEEPNSCPPKEHDIALVQHRCPCYEGKTWHDIVEIMAVMCH